MLTVWTGRTNVILTQNINKLLGVLIAPGGVKADGHHLLQRALCLEDTNLFAYRGALLWLENGNKLKFFISKKNGGVGMGVGVVHHLVAGVMKGFYRLWVFVYPLAYHKKSGWNGGLERKRFLLRHENCSLALQQWA